MRPGGAPLRRVTSFVRFLLSEDQGDCGCQCHYNVWESEITSEGSRVVLVGRQEQRGPA